MKMCDILDDNIEDNNKICNFWEMCAGFACIIGIYIITVCLCALAS